MKAREASQGISPATVPPLAPGVVPAGGKYMYPALVLGVTTTGAALKDEAMPKIAAITDSLN